jgi:hypothetical protein
MPCGSLRAQPTCEPFPLIEPTLLSRPSGKTPARTATNRRGRTLFQIEPVSGPGGRQVMIELVRRLRRSVPNVVLGVIIGMLVGGGAFAVAQTVKPYNNGVHGGPKPRFHDRSECNLVDVRQLDGNWTHGDYVSAVAKKDPSKVREAAHSRCGKPNHAGRGAKDRQKGNEGKEKERSSPSPSPKPSKSAKPSASPSATGSASPVVPLETPSPSASPT